MQKMNVRRVLLFLLISCTSFYGLYHRVSAQPILTDVSYQTIDTVYGSIQVSEPVIIEILKSAPMQRLKEINQYGVMAFIRPEQKYTRYEHSLGVFYLLRHFGASLEEQVAGLLHDISHTAFSHVADFLHGTHKDKYSYQDTIFKEYLITTGLFAILKKYGLERVAEFGKTVEYKMLKDDLPNLCADRLEYNLYGGLVEGWLTPQEIREIVQAVRYVAGRWIFTTTQAAEKFAKISIDLSVQNWCSAENAVASTTLADILKRGFDQGIITQNDFHYTTDILVWNKLRNASDDMIQQWFTRLDHLAHAYQEGTSEQHDLYFSGKFRGIDPLVCQDGLKQVKRLSEIKSDFARYLHNQEKMCREFFIRYVL